MNKTLRHCIKYNNDHLYPRIDISLFDEDHPRYQLISYTDRTSMKHGLMKGQLPIDEHEMIKDMMHNLTLPR